MKVWNYVFISITLMLILSFLGYNTGATPLLNVIGFNYTESSQEIRLTTSDSPIMEALFGGSTTQGILTALIGLGGALIAGFFARAQLENIILLSFITTTLVAFIQTWVGIFLLTALFPLWVKAIFAVIIVSFISGYIIALAEWFRGTD